MTTHQRNTPICKGCPTGTKAEPFSFATTCLAEITIMKNILLPLVMSLSIALPACADEVLSESPDNTVGYGAGGVTGLMVGAALGGPFGAIAGAALGAFGGAAVQQGSGHSDAAYVVRHDDGSTQRYRSPNARFKPGDQVQVSGIRLAPAQ